MGWYGGGVWLTGLTGDWLTGPEKAMIMPMKSRSIAGIVIAVGVGACVSPAVSREIAQAIPRDARAIRIYSDQPPADYYRAVYGAFASRGYAIAQESERMGTFSTQSKDIGEGTTLKVDVFVEEIASGSVATLRGQWGFTASFAVGLDVFGINADRPRDEANWRESGRPRFAFGEMATVANAVRHVRIEYLSR